MSPDGTIQVLSHEVNKIEIRDPKSGNIIDEIQYDDEASRIEFSKDSKSFVALCEESVKAYDILTHTLLFEIDRVPASWS